MQSELRDLTIPDTPTHIGIVGPIATADIVHLLECKGENLPIGYEGAPLLASLITELLKRGHTVSAFTLSSDMPLVKGGSVVIKNRAFSINYSPMRPRAWQNNGRHLGRIVDFYHFERNNLQIAIAQSQPEVLHAHWAYEFSLAALATTIPVVVTCHDSPFAIAKLNSRRRLTISAYRWLRVFMALKVFNKAKTITAVSPYMRDQIAPLTQQSIDVVPNPVDALAFCLSRPRQAPKTPRIAMVCNGWDARKNPEPGLRAFSVFRQNCPDAELHLFGNDFGAGQKAQQWCTASGLNGGLVFHGSTSHHGLLKALAGLDLLLHTSIEESFGMVLAEAMAMGLPVVAGQASGGVPWVVGEWGGLCDITNPEEIKHTLLDTLIPERYSQLSREGIESAHQRFSTKQVVDQFFALYQQATTHASTHA